MSEIISGIIGSLIASALWAVGLMIYTGTKGFPGIRISYRLLNDCRKAGIINIFPNRRAYIEHKDHGTASEYIMNVKSHLLYVGFWLSGSTEIGSVVIALKKLVLSNVKVCIVFIDPADDMILQTCSKFLGISKEEIGDRVTASLTKIQNLQQELPEEYKKYLEIKTHNVPLTASAFLLDYFDKGVCRILVDYKTYGFTREDSYGIEYKNSDKCLCGLLCKSYCKIADHAKKIE